MAVIKEDGADDSRFFFFFLHFPSLLLSDSDNVQMQIQTSAMFQRAGTANANAAVVYLSV